METFDASEAKREFGELLIKAQRSPVGIRKNGKPVAVVMSVSEYEALEALRENQLRQEIQKGLEDLQAGRIQNGADVIDRLRARIA